MMALKVGLQMVGSVQGLLDSNLIDFIFRLIMILDLEPTRYQIMWGWVECKEATLKPMDHLDHVGIMYDLIQSKIFKSSCMLDRTRFAIGVKHQTTLQ